MDISDIFKKGAYQGLKLGSTEENVFACFSNAIKFEIDDNLFIINCGPFEINTYQGIVINFLIKMANLEKEQKVFVSETLYFTNQSTLSDLQNLLTNANIAWEISSSYEENEVILVEKNKATIDFIDNEKKVNRIHLLENN